MLDELVLSGEVQETSKKNVLKAITAQDLLQEVCPSAKVSCISALFSPQFTTMVQTFTSNCLFVSPLTAIHFLFFSGVGGESQSTG